MNNSNYTTLGVDLVNYNFHDDVINDRRLIVKRGQLSRSMLLEQLSKMQIDKFAMEVCGTSYHWVQQLKQLNQSVDLMPAHKLKPHVQGNK